MAKAGPRKKRRQPQGRFAPATSRVGIVFEDAHVLVADKPPGLLTVSSPRERKRTMFRHLLDREQRRGKENTLFVVHKLERDASGLVLFCKREDDRKGLQEQLRAHVDKRVFRAVLEGNYPKEEETFKSYLAQNSAMKMYVARTVEGAQLAITHLKVVRRLMGATVIDATQETHCKHQLRVHVATAGHPIVGDRRYGVDRSGPVGRMALHATTLQFEHPKTGEWLQFKSPAPARFVTPFKTKTPGRRPSPKRRDR